MNSTLLVIPKFVGSKFGGMHNNVLSLATYLISKNHETYVLDLNNPDTSQDDLMKILEDKKPSLVGLTSTSPSHLDACDLAVAIKKFSKDILIVTGGKHDTVAWQTTLEYHPEIDIAVIGDGELILEELVQKIERGENYKSVFGIAYRDINENAFCHGYGMVPFKEIPFTDRTLIPHHNYYDFSIFNGKKTAQIMTQRGCRFKCNFCHVGQDVQERTVEQTIQELAYLKEHGYEAVFFDNGNFTSNRTRVIKTTRSMINAKLGLEWGCQTRADRVDEELLELMKEAGCTYIFYGVESASQEILNYLNKHMFVEDSRNAVKLTKKYGIRASISLMTGTPYENKSDLIKSFDFANELEPNCISLSLWAQYPFDVSPIKYEKRINVDPIFLKFDEGYGAMHHVTKTQAEDIYALAIKKLGNKII